MHVRATLVGVLDAASGELRVQRVAPRSEETVAWLLSLPQPVAGGLRGGLTGYGSRAPARRRVAYAVAAHSKIPLAPGERVKTDRRDGEPLARLLRLGEFVAVRVPDPVEATARDLVRARHLLSKLLPRHGLVYEGSAWTLAHDA